MKPIVIDTSGYSEFKRGDANAIAVINSAPVIGFTPIVAGELLAGFAAGSQLTKNRKELQDFLTLTQVIQFVIGRRTAEHYADVYQSLRKAGTPIPTNDLWVAASALEHGYAVFTYDQHFQFVPGLQFGRTVSELS
jgi:predicted nucleic acid-binding protein